MHVSLKSAGLGRTHIPVYTEYPQSCHLEKPRKHEVLFFQLWEQRKTAHFTLVLIVKIAKTRWLL